MKSTSAANLLKSRSQSAGFPSLISGYYDYNEDQNYPTTRYYYDGQMMVEDDYTVEGQNEPVVTVIRYGIGARGIDFMDKRVDDGPETKGYPIYDGHGNMIATLGQTQGSPYYSLADLRSYDVWGAVRSGSTNGDPKQRYCANLGHVQDDESGLIYMRARYYEPWSGRFISEDPARDGRQWFVYCRNNPLGFADANGKNPLALFLIFLGAAGILKTVTVMAPALHLLAIGLSRARDSFEVETLWNEYMDAYRGSSLLGEEGSLIARLAGTALQILNHAAGKAGAPWGIAVSGLSIGARGAFLCYGYQLRIAWYFADIDNY
ncbi:MAG: RHS repeat-associated core domain-containing protein [Fimbriimonadaceae bacterium]|nr:MAG: RHS repeat-associated core domain-containing protein [Fimbriimonadaceae bacterium]